MLDSILDRILLDGSFGDTVGAVDVLLLVALLLLVLFIASRFRIVFAEFELLLLDAAAAAVLLLLLFDADVELNDLIGFK